MKNIYIILLILFTSFETYSQNYFDFFYNSNKTSSSILLSGDVTINSDALTSKFLSTWIKSQYITSEIKNTSLSRLQKNNYAGVNFSGKAYYFNNSKKTNNYFIGYENNYQLALHFGDDLFRLTFLGNKSFENKSIIIDNTKFYSLSWNKIGGGIINYFNNDNKNCFWGASLNLNIPINYNYIEIKNAELYTATNGEYINIDANFVSHLSDTSKTSFLKGFGLSSDLFYSNLINENINFYLCVNNLGFIKMNKNSLIIQHDTSFIFKGIEINDIINNASMSWNIGSADSILNLYVPKYENSSLFIYTPCAISLGANYEVLENKLSFGLNLSHVFFIPYKPKVSIKSKWHLNNYFVISPWISYGGFSRYNFGLELNATFNRINFIIGSGDINGIALPQKSSGLSTFIALIYNL